MDRELVDWSWEPIASGPADVDGASVVASAGNHNSGALMSHSMESGRMSWTIVIDEETSSQCTTLGVAQRDCSVTNYQNDKAWVYRIFNGYRYSLGKQLPADASKDVKINKGDSAEFTLDMQAGTLELSINDGEPRVIFTDIHGDVAPCVFFYSTGPGRKVTCTRVTTQSTAPPKAPSNNAPSVSCSTTDSDTHGLLQALSCDLFSGGKHFSTNTIERSHVATVHKRFLEDLRTSGTATASMADEPPGARLGKWLQAVTEQERAPASKDAGGASSHRTSDESAAAEDIVQVQTDHDMTTDETRVASPDVASSLELDSPFVAGIASSSVASHPLQPLTTLKDTVSADRDTGAAVRACFAAFLWHSGIVNEAISAATYLQYHPSLGLQAQRPASDTVIGSVDSTLPPALRCLLHIWRACWRAIDSSLAHRDADAAKLPKADAAATSQPSAPSAPRGTAEFYEHLRRSMAEFSFKVRGGAEGGKAAKPDATIPSRVQEKLTELAEGRAGLPLHLTKDMRWEAKKARNIDVSADGPEGDRYAAGPARQGVGAGGGLFGAGGGAQEDAFICATPFEDVGRAAIHYFEVEIVEKGAENVVCVGLIPEHETGYRGHLGWSNKTMGYHGDDGVFHGSGMPLGETFTEGDTIGAGLLP
jgi:hypothetical protein